MTTATLAPKVLKNHCAHCVISFDSWALYNEHMIVGKHQRVYVQMDPLKKKMVVANVEARLGNFIIG